MKRTPNLNDKGFFEFLNPWVAATDVTYECLAVRSFEDIYKLGIDVYTRYYKSVGVINGKLVNGKTFDFEEEVALDPNIITLKGSDGTLLYIPDTFIKQLPDKSLIPYSEVVLGVSLGPIPDEEDLSSLIEDVTALIAARVNIQTTVNVCRVPTINHPTQEQHELMQQARFGKNAQIRPNTQMLLDDALEQIKLRDTKLRSLIKILEDKGLTQNLN